MDATMTATLVGNMEDAAVTKPLSALAPGESGVVQRVMGAGALKRRLFDMGITPGVTVYVRKTAPFGDPFELTVRGYELSLRKSQARSVIITPIEGGR